MGVRNGKQKESRWRFPAGGSFSYFLLKSLLQPNVIS